MKWILTALWARRLQTALQLGLTAALSATVSAGAESPPAPTNAPGAPAPKEHAEMLRLLDAPILFVKRHSYTGIHIYDTFYKWPPGGGGIHVLENPQAPRDQWRIRAVIDPSTPETLGVGVYSHPELSWDAQRLLFCFKGSPEGSTCIYEIGLDGRGLRRITDPTPTCADYKGRLNGQHDVAPAYLPDGRIIFISTRPSGLVPCNNTGVAILHVMNADGSDMHPISVNNVNEFDPSVLPDGRLLFGRWEYVDKNALTIQSLWTMHPDATEETAFFANNMVLPEAILDARPVPNSHLIVGTFAKHNAPPRGSIAFVDPRLGKNGPQAITNLEHPDDPTNDLGDSCEPWALSENVVLFSGRPAGAQRNVLELMDRAGHRFVLLSDPQICLHSPMLVKPRAVPPVLQRVTDRQARTGRFFLQDIYRGLEDVKRGEVKWLRVIEETSRVSGTHSGANPYNQTFLVSAALAFSVKNYHGVVPVDESGSAYFEVPSGRALYLQALDADGRLVQSMRTFVQAAPGATRSCIGCHEHKFATTTPASAPRELARRQPDRPQPESWGSGYMDYPSLVQPVLDRHCVTCHGGEKGIAAGLDLTGGWTEHFNISYENLTSRRESQLVAYLIAGIDCMNGTAHWSCQRFAPRQHGSGAAPLAKLLVEGHQDRIPNLSRKERDLLLAWIDSNGLYHGSWDYTEHGCAVREWPTTKQALVAEMQKAGCLKCHGQGGQPAYFESDWFNLEQPELSRILRAPLPKDAAGFGLGLCRDRKPDPQQQRIRLLVNGYAHAVQPVDKFPRRKLAPSDGQGQAVVSFTSTSDAHYQKMLGAIRKGRALALAAPRVDMPGAQPVAGVCRTFLPPPLPDRALQLQLCVDGDGVVHLEWERSARTIGLQAEIHRGPGAGFLPSDKTLLAETALHKYADVQAAAGTQHYALITISGDQRSQPSYASASVPPPVPPTAPTDLQAAAASCAVNLRWQEPPGGCFGYHVYRRQPDAKELRLTRDPVRLPWFTDNLVETIGPCSYVVRAISRRGLESAPSAPVTATALVVKEPVFAASSGPDVSGRLYDGDILTGQRHGKASVRAGSLDLKEGGFITFPHRGEFELGQPLSVECWVWFDQPGQMPVVVSCGAWQQAGWFLQRLGGQWRWHAGGLDCDGGQPAVGRWTHLVGTIDGQTARLFQDGVLVAERRGTARTDPWPGDLHVGQYSGGVAPPYQVSGRIAGVKIYHRPLPAAEVADASKVKPSSL